MLKWITYWKWSRRPFSFMWKSMWLRRYKQTQILNGVDLKHCWRPLAIQPWKSYGKVASNISGIKVGHFESPIYLYALNKQRLFSQYDIPEKLIGS